MIKLVRDLGDDWYVIELVGTQYHQIVNKWDVFELLLDNYPNMPVEDFPMSEEELADRLEGTKQLREFSKKINK